MFAATLMKQKQHNRLVLYPFLKPLSESSTKSLTFINISSLYIMYPAKQLSPHTQSAEAITTTDCASEKDTPTAP